MIRSLFLFRSYAVRNVQDGWIGAVKVSSIQSKNETEISMLQTLKHPYIIPYVGILEINQHLVVFTELADNYNLFDLLGKCLLTEVAIKNFAWQILLALLEIHKAGYIHGDLKLDNILFRTNPSTGGIDVQLSNFSLGRKIGEKFIQKENGISSGGFYYAPEALNTISFADPKMDMFSFGLILYCMLTRNHPIPGLTLDEYKKNVSQIFQKNVDVWFKMDQKISSESSELLSKLLVFNVNSRLTVAQALQSPFFPAEWRANQQQDGKGLFKQNASSFESLPKELFSFVFGEDNKNKQIQGNQENFGAYFLSPEQINKTVNDNFTSNKLPSEIHMQIFLGTNKDESTKANILKLKIFDKYL
ncbi:MAG: putative CAMK family protein kinase, partial [Streblomastix strix]